MSYSEGERKAAERKAKQLYIEQRQKEADTKTQQLESCIEILQTLLQAGLKRKIDSEDIISKVLGPFTAPPVPATPVPPQKEAFQSAIPQPGLIEQFTGFGKSDRLKATQQLQQRYKQAQAIYKTQLTEYNAAVQTVNRAKEERKQAIIKFHEQLVAKDSTTVGRYFAKVIGQSTYPIGFPDIKIRCLYDTQACDLVIEFELPPYKSIIPTIKGYKYVRANDEIQPIEFTQADERKMGMLYEEVVAAIALRTFHDIFAADFAQVVRFAVFNGVINTIDKGTGKRIRPCVVSVLVNQEKFANLDLLHVNPVACLKHLNAHISPAYQDGIPVKPIRSIDALHSNDKIDMSFASDDRLNLLEMDPFEFEHLIADLFAKMGLKTETTRRSRDGGIDVYAYDEHPVLGGKTIIQVKRYSNTVGVAAVRELYALVVDKHAAKGILVTTSGFGADSHLFAEDKQLRLINGKELLNLLEQHGFKAKIEIPT